MELCVAMKHCVTRYSSNEAGVLQKFARWLFHAKNINAFGVKPRAPVACWDPKSLGCCFVPSGAFPRAPCTENLCSEAGFEQCPQRECVFPVLQSAEETQLGCASSCLGSSTANSSCRLCGRGHCSHPCCHQLCSVQSAVPPGKESALVGDGMQGGNVRLSLFPLLSLLNHIGGTSGTPWLKVLAVLSYIPTVPHLFRYSTHLKVHKRGFDSRFSPRFNINLTKLFHLCVFIATFWQATEVKDSYCLQCPPKHPVIHLSSFLSTPLNLYLLF